MPPDPKRTLRPDDIGDDVAKFQEKLGAIGYEIPKDELDARRFGTLTADAVRRFQEANNIVPVNDAEVDDTTMKLIDASLVDAGVEIEVDTGPFKRIDKPEDMIGEIRESWKEQTTLLTGIHEDFSEQIQALKGFGTDIGDNLTTLKGYIDSIEGADSKFAEYLGELEKQTGLLASVEPLANQVNELSGIGKNIDQSLTTLKGHVDAVGAADTKFAEYLGKLDTQMNALSEIRDELVVDSFRPLTYDVRDERVKALHEDLAKVGLDVPEVKLNAKLADARTDLFDLQTHDLLIEFQSRHGLDLSGIYDEATSDVLAAEIAGQQHKHRLEGRIFLESGLPAAKIEVFVRDHQPLQDVDDGDVDALPSATTDEHGYYFLEYDFESIANGASSPNLEVFTKDADGKVIPLSQPLVTFGRNEVLNLVAPRDLWTPASEYGMMEQTLSGTIGGDLVALAKAKENGERRDLSVLAEKTHWDARLLATAASAAQVAGPSGISQQALYGAFRAGLPSDLEALALVTDKAFETALKRASDANVVTLDTDRIAAEKSAFAEFAVKMRRKMPAPGGLSSVDDLVKIGPLAGDDAKIEAFAKLAATHEGDNAALWRAAKKDPLLMDDDVAGLQLQGKMAYLTLNNAPLTELLSGEVGPGDALSKLVDIGLYREADWKARLEKLATGSNGNVDVGKLKALIPAMYTQADLDKRADAYAADMAAKVRRTFPTHVVGQMLANDELALNAELKAPTTEFIREAADKGFRLGSTPVDQYWEEQTDASFAAWNDDKKKLATDGARLLTRAYQMTPDDSAMAKLLELGFTSAAEVVAIPKPDFVDRYMEEFGSRRVTELVWEKSMQITSVTYNIYTMAKVVDSEPPLFALTGAPEDHEKEKERLKNALRQYPNMASLFGDLDFCECEHCRSVLSPAAYLVDLLRFTDPRERDWKHTLRDWKEKHGDKEYGGSDYQFLKPYDALMERRPDLPHLPLTCENTHTAMPYIDLVNEILEFYVVNQQLNESAVHDTGDATSAELMAEPLNTISDAYTTLREAKYPLTLPFDLWLETVRRFCAYHDTPFWQILETFRPDGDLFGPNVVPAATYRADILNERLGIVPFEYSIYTHADFADWYKLYGYDKTGDDATTAKAELCSAKTLSKRLGVSYKELVDLVSTWFVNPQLDSLVTLRKLDLDVVDVFRYKQRAEYAPLSQVERAEFEVWLGKVGERIGSGFDAAAWLDQKYKSGDFDDVVVLRDSDAGCSFDKTTVCYAGKPISEVDDSVFVRLNLFTRLKRRLGLSIAETDQLLHALIPKEESLGLANLGNVMRTTLVYLAELNRLAELLEMKPADRVRLVPLWGPLPTTGTDSLYARLFLTRNVLRDDTAFDHPDGSYLSDSSVKIVDHLPVLQAVLSLTSDEIIQILQDGNIDDESDLSKATLSLDNVSLLYRYALLGKLLRLSITDLIALKALSGLDPFQPLSPKVLGSKGDYAPRQTIDFVSQAQAIRESSLSVPDLGYICRHHFDPAGKHQPQLEVIREWVRTLATELRALAREFAVPANGNPVDAEMLRQKMVRAFAPNVVERFIGFYQKPYSETATGIPAAQKLDPKTYNQMGVTVAYDEDLQQQTVTLAGVLSESRKEAILAAIPAPTSGSDDEVAAHQTFSALLEKIEKTSTDEMRQFFADHFDAQMTYDDFPEAGVPDAGEIYRKMLEAILPNLHRKLERATIAKSMAAKSGGDSLLIEPIVAGLDLDARFGKLVQNGLTLKTSAEPDLTNLVTAPDPVQDVAVQAGANVNSACWQGYLEVPEDDTYHFYAQFGKDGAKAVLHLSGLSDPVLDVEAQSVPDESRASAKLKSGVLYELTLETTNLDDGAFHLTMKGETGKKSNLGAFTLLPATAVNEATNAQIMIEKALLLVQELGLSVRDIRHILANPTGFNGGDWRKLPTRAIGETDSVTEQKEAGQNATKLFDGILHLFEFTALKREMAGGTDDLIAVFETVRTQTPETPEELCERIGFMTRRKSGIVMDTATELGMTSSEEFADVEKMARLWQALKIVETLGVPLKSLKTWLTPQPDETVAKNVRNTIKARYEPRAWQRVAKEIFDPLRQLQRDALVAFVLHNNTAGIESVEQLFEYFLLDPQMEPVVQTSRIRLAISSLQTFIQRCFLNLEPRVHPSVLNAKHWGWMKRYRVWEANRKIFLFPENWLEPEWRDDKTHLYQELESTLLQGDVTNQLAEDALYVYLKKLEQLARLEIVTMYAEEKALSAPTIHVVGRTYTKPHQYFYRRYANRMWTPWEPITAEIESDHIVAVVWRERLHLFWLTFMEKIEESKSGPVSNEGSRIEKASVSKLVQAASATSKSAIKRTLDVQLSWSEYLQGEWSPAESSGFGNTISLKDAFEPAKVFVTVHKATNPKTGEEGAIHVFLNGLITERELALGIIATQLDQPLDIAAISSGMVAGPVTARVDAIMINGNPIPKGTFEFSREHTPYFRLVGKNGRPRVNYDLRIGQPTSPYASRKIYNRFVSEGSLSVEFRQKIVTTDSVRKVSPKASEPILKDGGLFTLLPTSNETKQPNSEFAPLISPLFYADDYHTFFVEPSLTVTTVDKWEGYTITRPSTKPKWDVYVKDPIVIAPIIDPREIYKMLEVAVDPTKVGPWPDEIDPRAVRTINPVVDDYMQPGVVVQYDNVLVGARGAVENLSGVSAIVSPEDGASWFR